MTGKERRARRKLEKQQARQAAAIPTRGVCHVSCQLCRQDLPLVHGVLSLPYFFGPDLDHNVGHHKLHVCKFCADQFQMLAAQIRLTQA